jgi:uncharacterized protein YndB with AHSA1/START domain
MKNSITVSVVVRGALKTVWNFWNNPSDIVSWMNASDDWECSTSINNPEVGGHFSHRLRAKDGSESFDLSGVYTSVVPHESIAYTLDDGRVVSVTFKENDDEVEITQTFQPENENSKEMQRSGWYAMLKSFKKYTEERAMANYDMDTE